MKKIVSAIKKIDYCHYICVGITIAFILMNIFCFPYTFPRLGEAFRDFGLSFAYQYSYLFHIDNNIEPSVTSLTKMPFTISDKFPETWELFKEKWDIYWKTFADGQTVIEYIYNFRSVTLMTSLLFSVFLPLLGLLIIFCMYFLSRKNNYYNEDTKPLKVFKRLSDKLYRPTKAWILSFVDFVKNYRFVFPENKKKKIKQGEIIEHSSISYLQIWAFVWVLNFNFLPILIEFVAFLYYFSASFDVGNIYIQVYKLLLDLSVMFKFVPVPVWVIVGLIIFDKIRKKRGYENLWHHELMNRGFINERGVFSLIVAPMRQGKTKLSVAMALSREVMFRDMAYKIILKCDLKFPYFPWINFERSLLRAMENHSVFNLVTCKRFVMSKMKKFYKHPIEKYLFDYDFKRYGMEYDNKKYIETLESVLSDYAQAYFIYVIESSLIVSNYAIRVDDQIDSIGNFPIRNADFFHTDSRLVDSFSRHSNIIDYNALRLGKKIGKESAFAFEFGIIDITEIAKERLNQLESQGMNRTSDETNQKNDGFDDWVKMCGHNATVDFTCFVSIYCDDQREQNLPASLREVGEILRVEKNEKDLLAMPGFFIGEIYHKIASTLLEKLHKKCRYNQGGNSLLYYILHTILSKMENYYQRVYNIFGYEEMTVSVQDGAQDNEKKNHKFYISNKKDLSKRYSTDCMSDILAVRTLRAMWGLDDVEKYSSERATADEIKKQNSFFINRITKQLNIKKD